MLDYATAILPQLSAPQLAGLYRLAVQLGTAPQLDRALALGLAGCLELSEARAGLAWLPGTPIAAVNLDPPAPAELQALLDTPALGALRAQGGVALLPPDALPLAWGPTLAAFAGATPERQALLLLTLAEPAAPAEPARQALAAALPLLGQAIEQAWQLGQLRATEANREQMINLLVHDIRSPLVATHASIEVTQRLLAGSTVSTTVADALQTGLRSVRSAVDLCNDMLEVKRLQTGYRVEKSQIQVANLIADVAAILKGLSTQRGCQVRQVVTPPDLMLHGDLRLLERVLINLVTNALRFIPDKGMIEIGGAPEAGGAGVLLTVSDNGPGVPADDRERIFQPFAQGSGEMRRGTGLGLYFCRQAVEAHGGAIWVENRSAGGCMFVVRLPG